MIIRPATKRDQAAVGSLWEAFLEEQAASDERLALADDVRERFDNDFAVWIDDGTQCTFVAERETGDGDAAALAGFATAHRWGPPPIYTEASEVFVNELYVTPEARREGVGRRLVEAVRAWADEIGADRLRLRVAWANEAGRAFWKDTGAAPLAATMTVELEGAEEEAEPRRIGF